MHQRIKRDLYLGQPEEAEGAEEGKEEQQERHLAQKMLFYHKKKQLNKLQINGAIKKLCLLLVILG
jgi:hypothetical protein